MQRFKSPKGGLDFVFQGIRNKFPAQEGTQAVSSIEQVLPSVPLLSHDLRAHVANLEVQLS